MAILAFNVGPFVFAPPKGLCLRVLELGEGSARDGMLEILEANLRNPFLNGSWQWMQPMGFLMYFLAM